MSVPDESARTTPDLPSDEHYTDPVLLEEDETVAPRPEEEIADLLRAEPAD
ncbi:hypothetical protein [Georgenia sunbinii]|uniref:hypothetical protein n=1 Tax=Georgenia sunbinii TaxID=3117728 RepID=UPI002F26A52A